MIFFCTHVSDFLAYGYRSEGCASWASPLTPFIFFIFSLSPQCVRHFAPISSNLGSGPTKLTLVIFWNLEKKNISLLVLNDKSKYPPRHCLLMRPALFYFLIEFFKWKNCFLLFFDDFFVPMCQICVSLCQLTACVSCVSWQLCVSLCQLVSHVSVLCQICVRFVPMCQICVSLC